MESGGQQVRDEKWLAKRVQEVRKSAGFTQQGLCQKAGLSYSTLAKIERGAIKAPSVFTIQSIAVALGTTLDALMETAQSPSRPRNVTQSGVRFIYFDVNGCLVQAGQRALTRIAEDTNMPIDVVETIYWRFNDKVCRGIMSMSDFNQVLADKLKVKSLDWQKYYIEAVEIVTPMQELVRWAHEHYEIGLITNVMPGLLSALKDHGLLPDLPYHSIVDSSEVGLIKPDSAIFKLGTERAGVEPHEILLIDDTQSNLQAAQRAGWHVLLLDDYDPKQSVARARKALEPAQNA
jgi:putative hydrolase of the HAD superfamily